MELEFEAGYEQFDMNISETLLDLHNAYPGILTCWDLASNQNEGLDLSSLATELNEAHHKETAVSQFQVDVVQQFQDSNCNSSTTNLSSDGKLRDDVKKISESSYSNRGQRQSKQKLRWTPELHGLFVEAVEKLGVDNAVPTKILDLMGVPSLTRYHIASHLQKYRATVKGLHGKEAGSTRKLRRQQLMCLNTNRSHDLQRSQPADAVFNTQCNYPAGDQCQSQPSNCMPILPATIAPATAVYEHSLARYLHGAEEDKEPVCSLDFQAHINSIATFEPWKDAVEQAIREDAVEQAIREALNDPCSHLPIGLIPPSPDSLTDVKSNGVDTRF